MANPKKPDATTRPPKLQALYEAAKRLAALKQRQTLWANTAKALGPRAKE